MSSIYQKKIISESQVLGSKYDYSGCKGRMAQYAFISPTNGEVTIEGVFQKIGDFRNEKTYQEYKDCGFDVMLILGNDKYKGEEFNGSELQKNLDLCEKVGLKCIAFDERLHNLTTETESLIGRLYPTFDDLVEYVRSCLEPYRNHPAFYGVTLYDEPRFQHLKAVGEITRAVKAVDENIFVHTCLLPYFASVDYGLLDFRTSLQGGTDEDTTTAYKKYIGTHLDNTGASYIAYDNYPIFISRGETCICFTYFHNLQMVANVAKERGAKLDLTIQTYADTNTEMRLCDYDDVRFQAYSALAFGAMNVSYFTYFMFPTRGKGCGICQAIMDDYGNKMLYYETKRVNDIAQKIYKVTSNFVYNGTNLYTTGEEPQLFNLVERTEFEDVKSVKAALPTLVNRLYDANRKVNAYMIINAEDIAKKLNDRVDMEFNGKSKAIVYVDGDPSFIELDNGKLTLDVSCGDGVLVIPMD